MDVKKTITSIFIVPTLQIGREKLQHHNYINGYVNDVGTDTEYEDSVYLLFKPGNIDLFRDFLQEEYERTKSIIEDYDYEDGFVVIVYQLDKKFKKDFELVKQGKYSKTSTQFQELFPKVVKMKRNGYFKDEVSLQHRVFNKTQDLRTYWEEKLGVDFDESMEVWHGFDFDNEILDIEKLKEHV